MKMETTIDLHFKEEEAYYATNTSGNRIEIDMYQDDKQAMSPTELLLSGVIACAAVDIAAMIRKRRKTLIDLKGKATGTRRNEHPRKFTDIHIQYYICSPDLSEEEVAKIIDLAVEKYCSVAATLNESTNLTHGFSIKKD
jgi:putative redox protein